MGSDAECSASQIESWSLSEKSILSGLSDQSAARHVANPIIVTGFGRDHTNTR